MLCRIWICASLVYLGALEYFETKSYGRPARLHKKTCSNEHNHAVKNELWQSLKLDAKFSSKKFLKKRSSMQLSIAIFCMTVTLSAALRWQEDAFHQSWDYPSQKLVKTWLVPSMSGRITGLLENSRTLAFLDLWTESIFHGAPKCISSKRFQFGVWRKGYVRSTRDHIV